MERSALEKELHELCQPLTSLACLLEYGQILGDAASLRSAVDGALVECRRAFDCVAVLREEIGREQTQRTGAATWA